MFSTSSKIAFGYIVLIGLLIGSVKYIYQQMELLSERNETESLINNRRQTTHKIISKLYEIEIIGQTLHSGSATEYRTFSRKMKEVQSAIDTLQTQVSDSLQCHRLDTLRALLRYKSNNMRAVTKALQRMPTDEIYQQQFDSLLTQQDSLLNSSHIRRRVITHHNTYTIHNKPKGFFKRIANVFAPGKEDSVEVSNIIQEEIVDTLEEAYNPIDTIASMLTDIKSKVFETRQKELRTLDSHITRLRIAGSDLSKRVNQLLETIEREEQEAAQRKFLQEHEIRNNAAWTMATISIFAVVLVLIFFTIIWRDLTKSNHYRRELEKAKLYAENLLVAREKLMLTITHDIKAPAGSIIGYLDLLNRLVKDKRQLFYLNNMQSAAQHLLNLVTSLLDFHRLEAGKMDLNPVSFKPCQLLENIYHCFLPLAEKKQIELNLHLEMESQLTLEGDPFRLRQIVENLLSNALKFTAEGTITLESAYQGNQFIIRVSDTGCGMTHEEQQRIFNEFTRLHSAQGQEGFGLGLSITRKLIDLQHGKIRVNSVPHVGSSFEVSIPLPSFSGSNGSLDGKANSSKTGSSNAFCEKAAIQQKDDTPKEYAEGNNADNRLTKEINNNKGNKEVTNETTLRITQPLRILTIDDDKIQLQLTEVMLHRVLGSNNAETIDSKTTGSHDKDTADNYSMSQQELVIRCCEQPEEILSLLQEGTYDLVLTDIQMPAMNGFELLKAIRNLPNNKGNHIAVVAITARGDMNEDGFKEKGFAGMLQKPFNLTDLRQVLTKVLPEKIGNSDWNQRKHAAFIETATHESTEKTKANLKKTRENFFTFDFDSLLVFTDGDEEAAQEILTTFIQETEKNIKLIQLTLEEKNYHNLCEIGHKMLPTFTMIKADEAVRSLQWLESKRNQEISQEGVVQEAREKATIIVQYAQTVILEAKKRCQNKNMSHIDERQKHMTVKEKQKKE